MIAAPAYTDYAMLTDHGNATHPPADALLETLQQRLGYHFRDANMLLASLTHASGAEHRLGSNERLEFPGDAILVPWSAKSCTTNIPNTRG